MNAYRSTFLRWHMPAVLADYHEVQAVYHLIRRAQQLRLPVKETQKEALLNRFFDSPTWLEIKLAVQDERLAVSSGSLAKLLHAMGKADDPRGVLLTARPGAGKTVNAIKAFRECFAVPGSGELLKEYLPVWLPVTGMSAATSRQYEQETRYPIEALSRLVGRAAAADKPQRVSLLSPFVPQWLRYSPPLLIFVDLNRADTEFQKFLAKSIPTLQWHFIDQYKSGDCPSRHRFVVLYRSSLIGDSISQDLTHGPFLHADMEPVNPDLAPGYLLAFRKLEQQFFTELGWEVRRQATSAHEAKTLEDLLKNYSRDGESLMSTPLLLHLACTLEDGALEKADSPTRLYDLMVDAFLDHELSPPSDQTDVRRHPNNLPAPLSHQLLGRWCVKTAMTRVALGILGPGPHESQLSEKRYHDLLERPEDEQAEMSACWRRKGEKFWPAKPYYHNSQEMYFDEFDVREKILEHSLLMKKQDAPGTVRFIHDSFIHYFAGVLALRWYKGPGTPSDPRPGTLAEWHQQVVERIRIAPAHWEQAAEFLGGTLNDKEELKSLAREILLAEPADCDDVSLAAILHRLLLGRSRDLKEEPVLRALEAAAWRTESRRFPSALFSLSYHWLCDPQDGCSDYAATLSEQARRCWLRTDPPVPRPRGRWHRSHVGEVTCIVAVDRFRVASAGSDGSVLLWDVQTGRLEPICRHEAPVRHLEVLSDGALASGSQDGEVKVCWPGPRQRAREPAGYRHQLRVQALAALDDGALVSAGFDGEVRLFIADETQNTDRRVFQHEERITCLVAFGVRKALTVVMGDDQGRILVWKSGWSETFCLGCHSQGSGVTRLLRWTEQQVLSVGGGGEVILWNVENFDHAESGRLPESVHCLTVPHRRRGGPTVGSGPDEQGLIFANDQGRIFVWSHGLVSGESEEVFAHEGGVNCLAALPGGGLVSGGRDGVVTLHPRHPRSLPTSASQTRVRCCAFREGSLIVGHADGSVIVSAIGGAFGSSGPQEVHCHADGVTCVAALPDLLASGGGDGKVVVWERMDGTDRREVYRHQGAVRVLKTFFGLPRLVSGGQDGVVTVWWPPRRRAGEVFWHDGAVNCLDILSDGGLVSGGRDGAVAVWRFNWPEAIEVFRHDDSVTCVATPRRAVPIVDSTERFPALAASGGRDGKVAIWRSDRGVTSYQDTAAITCLRWLSDGRLVWGTAEGDVRFWSVGDGGPACWCRPLESSVTYLEVLGADLAVGLQDGRVLRLDADQRERLLFHHHAPLSCLRWVSKMGLVSGGRDGVLAVSLGNHSDRPMVLVLFDVVEILPEQNTADRLMIPLGRDLVLTVTAENGADPSLSATGSRSSPVSDRPALESGFRQ